MCGDDGSGGGGGGCSVCAIKGTVKMSSNGTICLRISPMCRAGNT